MGPQHALNVASADAATPNPATLSEGAASFGALAGSYVAGTRTSALPVDPDFPRAGEQDWLRRQIFVTALAFVLLVAILTGIAGLMIDFEPLFALTYAVSYGALAAGALLVVAAILWLLVVPARSMIAAAREWSETRDARDGLRVLGWAVCSLAAAGAVIALALVTLATA